MLLYTAVSLSAEERTIKFLPDIYIFYLNETPLSCCPTDMCTSYVSWYCLQGQAACGPQNHNPAVKSVTFLGFLVPTYNTERYSHFHLLSVSNIFMYLWRLTFRYYKTYIASFFRKKRDSFCLMVEASDHGYVLHTRCTHVTRYRI
jgi:hypothetical protein